MADRDTILAAIESRRGARGLLSSTPTPTSNSSTPTPTLPYSQRDYQRKQEFRRLVDTGIIRPNSREVAYEAIRTLLKLSENIIDHPEEDKYHRFKPTNDQIRKKIVDPKGALEYAVELGFMAEIVDFQPFYIFHKSKWEDLRIGHGVLKEFNERQAEAEQRLAKAKAEERAAIKAQKEKTRLAFLDDRITKMQQDERERERLAFRAAKQQNPEPEPETEPASPQSMPGIGRLLSETTEDIAP